MRKEKIMTSKKRRNTNRRFYRLVFREGNREFTTYGSKWEIIKRLLLQEV